MKHTSTSLFFFPLDKYPSLKYLYLGDAYRLYRGDGGFGGTAVPVEGSPGGALSAFAARRTAGGRIDVVLLNKSERPAAVDLSFAGPGRGRAPGAVTGFDAERATGSLDEKPEPIDGGVRATLPPRSARRYAFG